MAKRLKPSSIKLIGVDDGAIKIKNNGIFHGLNILLHKCAFVLRIGDADYIGIKIALKLR